MEGNEKNMIFFLEKILALFLLGIIAYVAIKLLKAPKSDKKIDEKFQSTHTTNKSPKDK